MSSRRPFHTRVGIGRWSRRSFHTRPESGHSSRSSHEHMDPGGGHSRSSLQHSGRARPCSRVRWVLVGAMVAVGVLLWVFGVAWGPALAGLSLVGFVIAAWLDV